MKNLITTIDKKKIHRATVNGLGVLCGQDLCVGNHGPGIKVFLVTKDLKKVTCQKCKYGVGS